MTLGDMREIGVRSLAVSCWICHHQAVLSAEHWPEEFLCQHLARALCVPAAG
jgi:hypothetical protein